MTTESEEQVPSLEERAEAAAWLAHLRGPERTPEVERGFQRWLEARPTHRLAFEQLDARLEVVERLKTRSLPRHWRKAEARKPPVWQLGLAVGAALAAVLAGLALYSWLSGVSTAVGEQRMLSLQDGTRVYLNTDTRVVVRYDEHRRLIELKSGEALFDVARRPGLPFVVTAGDRKVQALGTSFLVRYEQAATQVVLIEGAVSVSPLSADAANVDAPSAAPTPGAPRVLTPGQRVTYRQDGSAQLDRPAIERVAAWRQGQVAIDDQPLSQAIVEMNRYSAVKLVVADDRAAELRVGGFFRMGDSASFARAVAATYGLRLEEGQDQIVLASPGGQSASTNDH